MLCLWEELQRGRARGQPLSARSNFNNFTRSSLTTIGERCRRRAVPLLLVGREGEKPEYNLKYSIETRVSLSQIDWNKKPTRIIEWQFKITQDTLNWYRVTVIIFLAVTEGFVSLSWLKTQELSIYSLITCSLSSNTTRGHPVIWNNCENCWWFQQICRACNS